MTYKTVSVEDRGGTARLISIAGGHEYREAYDLAINKLRQKKVQERQLWKIKSKVLRPIAGGCTYKIIFIYEAISSTEVKLVLLNLCVRGRSRRYHIVSEGGETDVPCS